MEDFPQLQSLSKFELFTMGRSKYASLTVASSQTHADDKEEEAQTEEVRRRLLLRRCLAVPFPISCRSPLQIPCTIMQPRDTLTHLK